MNLNFKALFAVALAAVFLFSSLAIAQASGDTSGDQQKCTPVSVKKVAGGNKGVAAGSGGASISEFIVFKFKVKEVECEEGGTQLKGALVVFTKDGKEKYKLANIEYTGSEVSADIVPKKQGQGGGQQGGASGTVLGSISFTAFPLKKYTVWHGSLEVNGVEWDARIAGKAKQPGNAADDSIS